MSMGSEQNQDDHTVKAEKCVRPVLVQGAGPASVPAVDYTTGQDQDRLEAADLVRQARQG